MLSVSDDHIRVFFNGNIEIHIPRSFSAEVVHGVNSVAFFAGKSDGFIGKFYLIFARHIRKSYETQKSVLRFKRRQISAGFYEIALHDRFTFERRGQRATLYGTRIKSIIGVFDRGVYEAVAADTSFPIVFFRQIRFIGISELIGYDFHIARLIYERLSYKGIFVGFGQNRFSRKYSERNPRRLRIPYGTVFKSVVIRPYGDNVFAFYAKFAYIDALVYLIKGIIGILTVSREFAVNI